MQIELQVRTHLQHIWATSVETSETFLKQSLKSNQGPQPWLDFFALVGAAFSIIENCPKVPGFENLSDLEIYKKIKIEAKELDVISRLRAFNAAARMINTDKNNESKYHLLILDLDSKNLVVQSYSNKSFSIANKDYTKYERENRKFQVALVSTNSIETLKKAYPNYFLDTHAFIEQLNKIIEKT